VGYDAGAKRLSAKRTEEGVWGNLCGSPKQNLGGSPGQAAPFRIDPASRRVPVSGREGMEFVTIGAPLGRLYEPPSWG
jgi:hypothetical protein